MERAESSLLLVSQFSPFYGVTLSPRIWLKAILFPSTPAFCCPWEDQILSLSVFAFQLLSARCCGATADSIEPRCSVILSIRGFTDALFCFRQLQFKVYVLPLELLNFHAVFEGRCLTPWMLCECFYPFRSQSTLCTSIRSAGTCQLVFSCCLYVLNYRCSEVMAGSCSAGADKDLGCSGKEKWWFSKDCLHTGRNRKL